MKKIYLPLFLITTCYAAAAQDTTACYFDEQLRLSSKKNFAFEGKIIATPEGWEAFALYSDGKYLMHGFFKDKKLTFKQGLYVLYFPNGKKHLSTSFKENVIEGEFMGWYENGQISDSGIMRQGLKTGVWKTWYATGQQESEGMYKEGITDSIWRWSHPNGKPATIELYRNSKMYDLTCFDTSGNKTGSNCRIDKKPCPERSFNFDQYIIENLLYPKPALKKGIEGTVAFEFFVTKEGKLTRINFTNTSDELLQQEVVRLLKAVPKWEPAVSHNRNMDYLYSYEVPFYLPQE